MRSATRSKGAVSGYDGFLSYSHAVDGKLTPVLQTALQRFAKPWYRLRALRIFRDDASLTANPHLWSAIEQALSQSRWFILMASPRAAQSPWVDREAAAWCSTKSPDRLLLVLTDGEIAWDNHQNDFDWLNTTALPPSLRGVFQGEPLYIDLRWAGAEDQLVVRHPRFKDAVASIAAPLHGCSKDELFGEDVRQYRRARRLFRSGVAVLTALVVLVASSTVVALRQRDAARRQRDIAASRYIASQAVTHRATAPARSLLEGIESLNVADTAEGRSALFGSLQSNPRLHGFVHNAYGALAFSPDGRTLAFRRDDRVELSDRTRPDLAPISFPLPRARSLQPSLDVVAFDPSGNRVTAVTDEGLVIRWDGATRTQIDEVLDVARGDIVGAIELTSDGRLLATTAGRDEDKKGGINLWDLDSRQVVGSIDGDYFFGLPMTFSADGKVLVTGGPGASTQNPDGSILLWDVPTLQQVGEPLRAGDVTVRDLAVNSDGSLVASADIDGAITLWDVRQRSIRHRLVGHTGAIAGMAFTPDSSTLVSTSDDNSLGLWDTDSGRLLERLVGNDSGFGEPSVGPDGTLVAVGGTDGIVLWNLERPQPRLGETLTDGGAPVSHVSFSPDGSTLVVSREDGRISVWDVAERAQRGDAAAAPEGQDGPDVAPFVRALFSSEGALVTLEDDSGTVMRWEAPTSELRGEALDIPGRTNSSGAFSPDGSTLAVGRNDGSVVLWDVRDARQTAEVPADGSDSVWAVAFSPDGSLLAVLAGTTIRIWDVEREAVVGGPLALPPSRPTNMAFDSGGRRLTVGLSNGTIQVWDVRDMKLVDQPAEGRPRSADYSLALRRDGGMIATGGGDGSILLWDVAERQALGPPLLAHTSLVRALAFSPDGKTLASGGDDGVVVLWHVGVEEWRAIACAVANRNLTPFEWRVLRIPRHYAATCP